LIHPYRLFFVAVTLLTSLSSLAVNVDIRGGEDPRLVDNIKAHLAVLKPPLNCRLSEDYNSTISGAVALAAQALGYYQLTITSLALTDNAKCLDLTLGIQPGTRVTVGDIRFELQGEGQNDPVLISQVRAFPLSRGDKLEHQKYSSAKRKLLSLALQRGYFDATYQSHKIGLDLQANSADLELILATGRRYHFGELIMPADSRAKRLIEQVRPFATGDNYDAELLAKFNQNLKLSDYFEQVVARPLVNDALQYQLPIEIIMTNKPKDIYKIGGGLSTDTGFRVRVKWQRPWVNSRGHSISAELFTSLAEQSTSLVYKVPLEDPLNNYFSFQGGYKADNANDTRSETHTVAVQRHWGNLQNSWKKAAFLRYELVRFRQGVEPRQSTQLLLSGASLSRRRSKGGLDIYWGDEQQLTIEGGDKKLLSDIDLARLTLRTTWLRSRSEHRLLMRAEFGAIATNDFDRVPSSLRYFAGGDQSVRGFGYESLSPIEDGQLSGGKYLNVLSAEYSYPLSQNWRVAIFSDLGNASDKPFKNLASGIGVGASWLSPVGPIRLYLAKGNSEFDKTWRLHLSMGPAL
jgi:translocation and assembly module TamA